MGKDFSSRLALPVTKRSFSLRDRGPPSAPAHPSLVEQAPPSPRPVSLSLSLSSPPLAKVEPPRIRRARLEQPLRGHCAGRHSGNGVQGDQHARDPRAAEAGERTLRRGAS